MTNRDIQLMRKVSLLIALFALVVSGLPALALTDQGPFHRGINIHHAMNWAALDRAGENYAFPPFANKAYELRNDELQRLRRAGFDFVRLTIDPGPFLQFEAAERDALDGILMDHVRQILAADLAVIVDFHPNNQHKSYLVESYVRAPDDPFVLAFSRVLTRTAGILGELRSSRVALELLNEPWTSGPFASRRWQRTLEAYHAAARRGSADLQIIVSGGDAGSARALVELDPSAFGDNHTIYTFHCYTPLPFTLQGEAGSKTGDLSEVPYPLGDRPSDHTLDAIRSRINTTELDPDARNRRFDVAKRYLEWIIHRGAESTTPARNFQDVAAWADRYGIAHARILLGEFGVAREVGSHHGAPERDRLAWLAEIKSTADRYGFPWAFWSYRSYSGMMLVSVPGSDELDAATMSALGLVTRTASPSPGE